MMQQLKSKVTMDWDEKQSKYVDAALHDGKKADER
jgi:hypothetical protein